MKISYVANIRIPTERAHGVQILKACEAFALAGHEVELLVPNRKNSITANPLSYYGIKTSFPIRYVSAFDTVSWGSFGFLIHTVSFAVASIRTISADSIVYGRDEFLLSTIGLFRKNKLFWESHDGRWNSAARYLRMRAAGIIVVTKGAEHFYAGKHIPEKKLLTTPNGIDLDAFNRSKSPSDSRRALGIPQEARVAMYVGALDGWKGTETFFKAAQLLADVRAVVIGGTQQQIERLRRKYPGVMFLGARPYAELPDNQIAADVLVVPNTGKDRISVHFTSPLKLLAHMASGVPIVASDLPSIRELVTDDDAILVTPDDPEALARGILSALDPAGRAIADRAKQRVQDYTWRKRAENIGRFVASRL